MAKFKYIAEDTAGVRKEGFREADNEGEVVEWIYDSGLLPVSISEISPKKNTTPEPKYAKNTPQSMADGFALFAKIITETVTNSQNDSVLVTLYNLYRQSVKNWINFHKGVKNCPALTNLPTLKENKDSPYMAMLKLAEYCEKPKAIRRYGRWQQYKPMAEALVEKYGFSTKKALYLQIPCPKNTLEKIIEHSDILKKAIKQPHPERKRPVGLPEPENDTGIERTEKPPISNIEVDETLAELLEIVRRETPQLYPKTKADIDSRGSDERRELAEAIPPEYLNRPSALSLDATQQQYKKL